MKQSKRHLPDKHSVHTIAVSSKPKVHPSNVHFTIATLTEPQELFEDTEPLEELLACRCRTLLPLLLFCSGCRKRSITWRIVECLRLNGFVYILLCCKLYSLLHQCWSSNVVDLARTEFIVGWEVWHRMSEGHCQTFNFSLTSRCLWLVGVCCLFGKVHAVYWRRFPNIRWRISQQKKGRLSIISLIVAACVCVCLCLWWSVLAVFFFVPSIVNLQDQKEFF